MVGVKHIFSGSCRQGSGSFYLLAIVSHAAFQFCGVYRLYAAFPTAATFSILTSTVGRPQALQTLVRSFFFFFPL
jgi:hypothetical protein